MKENRAIVIAYLGYITLGSFDGLIGVVWPAMSQSFGVPLEALGILLMVSLVGFVSVSFNSGAIIRARSMRWYLAVGLILRTLGFLGLALMPTWSLAVAAIFVGSLGAAAIDSGLNTFVSARGNARQLNWLHAAFGIGATTGPFLSAAVIALGGTWNWSFLIVAVFMLILAAVVWRTPGYWDVDPSEIEDEPKSATAKMGETLRMPIVWISVMVFFLYVGTELTAGQWTFSLFTLSRGIAEQTANFWVGIYWAIFTLARIGFGAVANRIDLSRFLRAAMLVTVAGAVLLWWNPLPWVGIAGLVVMGMAEAPVYPTLIAETNRNFGRRHAANAIGFQVAAGGVGGTAVSSLVGVVAAATSLEAIAVFAFGLALCTWVTYEVVGAMAQRRKPQIA